MTLGFTEAKWTQDSNGLWLNLRVDNPQAVRKLCRQIEPGKKYQAKISRAAKRRSLDANAYFWVLAGKLAAKLHISVREVYLSCIREIGDNFQIVPIREDAVHKWAQIWAAHGSGWIIEDLGECRNIPGYHYIQCFYGSSVYDTRQMSLLIDMIIQECKQQEIETLTPDEIAQMKARWEDAQYPPG